ncbi:RNA polymerase II mediator complex subunit [Dispira simplex]|nr:RNA polymerase II mediator complex subunit [Dispira simplex]
MSSPSVHQAETKVKEIIDTLFELGITVQDFRNDDSTVIQNRINDLVTRLAQLGELATTVEESIPLDVLSCIEEGKNPDLLLRGVVDQAAAENQFTRGKLQTMEKFRDVLLEELDKTLPEQLQAYQGEKRPSE